MIYIAIETIRTLAAMAVSIIPVAQYTILNLHHCNYIRDTAMS